MADVFEDEAALGGLAWILSDVVTEYQSVTAKLEAVVFKAKRKKEKVDC